MALNIISFLSGTLFSIGLVISGMTNPKKVIGFLDIFGEWDYSLAFVMIGAIGVNFTFMKLLKRDQPIFCEEFSLPTKKVIDHKLLIGASLFGVGWGLVGICPGPGIVNLVTFNLDMIIFVVSMIMGMYLFKLKDRN